MIIPLPRIYSTLRNKRIFSLSVLCCFAFALSGCGIFGSGSTEPPLAGSTEKQLAYGVSVAVPKGWTVDNTLAPEAATKAAIDARAAKGERVMLISMFRPASTPEGRNGLIALFLVDAARNFPPEDRTAALTADELDRYGQAVLTRDREAAARNQGQSNLLTWKVTKTQLDGRLALIHKGTAQGPSSVLNLCDVNVYLPDGKGLALKSMVDPAVPGTVELMDGIIASLRIKQKQ